MKHYLIIGANSAIATACARRWLAAAGDDGGQCAFLLVARDREKLEQTAADLRGRGAGKVISFELDVRHTASYSSMLQVAQEELGQVDVALIAHGTLPDQQACEGDASLALEEFTVNCSLVIALATLLANLLEAQGHGTLAVITSVAGVRGRRSNYLYGSAKAAVSTFCDGLRIRLASKGVHVIDVRPGFVDTPMTAGLELPATLVASPDEIARRITRGIDRNRAVLYAPAWWALIMCLIRLIPRPVFRRLPL